MYIRVMNMTNEHKFTRLNGITGFGMAEYKFEIMVGDKRFVITKLIEGECKGLWQLYDATSGYCDECICIDCQLRFIKDEIRHGIIEDYIQNKYN
jgi:hypothetical protein